MVEPLSSPPPGSRARVRGTARGALSLLAVALLLGGCAGNARTPPAADAAPSEAALRQAARSAVSGKGQVDVRLVGGVAYVSGTVENPIDERAVLRALRRFDGVERVESHLQREM